MTQDRAHQSTTTAQETRSENTHAPKRKSVWTPKQKLIRAIWGTLGSGLWIVLPAQRSSILRLFGAKVGKRCVFPRHIDIVVPWNLAIGDNVRIGEHTILYSLGMITIGDGCVLDTKAHLCAGTHDMSNPLFPLIRPPITLGQGCFVGFDAYIAPNVVLGDRTRVYPRSSVYRSSDPDTIWRGNPGVLVESADESESATIGDES